MSVFEGAKFHKNRILWSVIAQLEAPAASVFWNPRLILLKCLEEDLTAFVWSCGFPFFLLVLYHWSILKWKFLQSMASLGSSFIDASSDGNSDGVPNH